jgi:hypothetical protein
MVYYTSIYTFCNKQIDFTKEIIIIAISKFLGNFLWTIFLKLFLRELIYEFIDSIDLIWCNRHRFTHSVINKLVLTREIIIIATSKFLGNFLWTIFQKQFLHELIYEFIDSIDLKWCIIHRFTHFIIKKLVLTREIIIIATSNFLGNFLWTIFLKLFLHELIYEFNDSIDLIWFIRHRYTHSVIKKFFVTREIIIIANSNFLGNFLWTIFQKLFFHELIYEFIDSIDLKWCIRHRFTHSVIKKLVLTREIIIIATSKFLGNFLWTIFQKLFLHEFLYEFIDSIDLKWCIRQRYTHSVINKLVLTREIIIIATSKFLRNFLWTIFLELFIHELIYEFIDSIDLKWCKRHRFTHSVIKKWF